MASAVVGLALQGAPVGRGGLARLVLRLTQQTQVEGGAAVLRIARQGRQDLLFGSRQVVAAQQESAQVAVRRGKLPVAGQGLAIGLFRARRSKYQPWNSVAVGPHKDLIGGWATAARKNGLRFGVSVHASHAWIVV